MKGNLVKKWITMAGCALLSAYQPALAEPIDDARLIVEKTVTRQQFELAFVAIADLMLGSMQNEAAKSGQSLSDDAANVVVEMLTERMVDAMLEQMREPLAHVYVVNFSPDVLAAYRAFLETEAGSEIAGAAPVIMMESMKIGEQIGGDIASLAVSSMIEDMKAEKWPDSVLKSTRAELRNFYVLPEVSEMPVER